ncbi:MAG: GatB/YqeY domain-containing protein [Ketobacteraceae bacterium]|nr:GatB/YqeY domain-containing protein [Ketobacteraceae bacterium]
MSTIKEQLNQAVKDAMRAKDKVRLGTLRMATAAFKQIEVDERIEVDDTRALAVLDKLIKQRKDAASQYKDANRTDLMEQELAEADILQEFMPHPLSDDEVKALIDKAIAESGAESMKDMGKVMAVLKPQIQGRTDMGQVSKIVKTRLN